MFWSAHRAECILDGDHAYGCKLDAAQAWALTGTASEDQQPTRRSATRREQPIRQGPAYLTGECSAVHPGLDAILI